jgi:sterol desaturase/sphingolipid hydroxylase (fatty acid hydroxylase superfamily)
MRAAKMNDPQWLVAHGKMIQLVAFYGCLLFFALLEIGFPLSAWPPHRKRRWSANFLLLIAGILALAAVPVTGLGVSVWAAKNGFGLLNRVLLPLPIVLALTVLVRSLASWILHIVMHKVPLLWRIHRTHHLDENMDVSTTVRFHPLEILISLLAAVGPIALFGLPLWALVVYEALETAVRLFSHANIRLPHALEMKLRLFISTPDFHRIHHSIDRAETDSNYGVIFSCWDHLFRTYVSPEGKDLKTMRLGLAGNEGPKTESFRWLLGNPFLKKE